MECSGNVGNRGANVAAPRGVKEEDNHGVWKNNPNTISIHTEKHGLVDAWRRHCKGIWNKVKTQKRLTQFANQGKLCSYRYRPIYMFGVQVPRNWHQARELDKENGNTRWLQAKKLELQQIDDYDSFKDLGDDFEKVKHKLKG